MCLFIAVCTETVCVVTCDGRIIVGILAGHDQVQNLILQDAHERVYSSDADVEEVPLGLYVIRGDNLCLVGEFLSSSVSNNNDAMASSSLPDNNNNYDQRIRVPFPLPPIQQHQF
jgi:U6 snRNA-associated Sm-like protein LSm8